MAFYYYHVDDDVELTFDDFLNNNIDVSTVAHILETCRVRIGKSAVTNEESRARALREFLDGADVLEYLWLCDSAEKQLKMRTCARQLRGMLNPTRFQWQWVNSDDMVMSMSPNTRFPDEESCKADAWEHAPAKSTHAKLWIVGLTGNGSEIGAVYEHYLVPEDDKLEVVMCRELGDDVRMEVLKEADQYSVDIRRWTLASNKRLIPTKKGIRLSLQCFVRLMWMRDQTQDMLEKVKSGAKIDERILVGRAIYLKFNSPFINIHLREYYQDEDVIKPGCRGIILKLVQWEKLLTASNMMHLIIPGFSEMTPCYMNDDHNNQEGALACRNCNFFSELD